MEKADDIANNISVRAQHRENQLRSNCRSSKVGCKLREDHASESKAIAPSDRMYYTVEKRSFELEVIQRL